MNTNIELKNEISVDEYKAWLTGLLRGKGNQLPDLKDWKAIKKMTDKIVPDVIETTPWQTPSDYTPSPNLWENQPTCTYGVEYLNGITITSGSASMELKDSGDISINGHSGMTDSIAIGSIAGGDYGCYGGTHASSYTPPPAPSNSIMSEEERLAASEILNKIRERSAESKKSLAGHKFDTSKYNIISTPTGHTAKLIKEALSIEDEK